MKAPHILVFVGYACFGVGMLLGQALGNSIWWIVATVVAGLSCIVMLVPFHHRKPRKKKLPVRRASRVVKRNVRLVR